MKRLLTAFFLLVLCLVLATGCRTKQAESEDHREIFTQMGKDLRVGLGQHQAGLTSERERRNEFLKRAREFRRETPPPSNVKFTPRY